MEVKAQGLKVYLLEYGANKELEKRLTHIVKKTVLFGIMQKVLN